MDTLSCPFPHDGPPSTKTLKLRVEGTSAFRYNADTLRAIGDLVFYLDETTMYRLEDLHVEQEVILETRKVEGQPTVVEEATFTAYATLVPIPD